MVGALEPQRGVRRHREEGDEEGAEDEGETDVLDPDQEQRRDGDQGRDLDDHRERKEAPLDPLRLNEEHGQPRSQDGRGEQRLGGDGEGLQQRRVERRPVVPQRRGDAQRARQQVFGHVAQAHHRLPGGQGEEGDQGRNPFGEVVPVIPEVFPEHASWPRWTRCLVPVGAPFAGPCPCTGWFNRSSTCAAPSAGPASPDCLA